MNYKRQSCSFRCEKRRWLFLREFIAILCCCLLMQPRRVCAQVNEGQCSLCSGGAEVSNPDYQIEGVPDVPQGTSCGVFSAVLGGLSDTSFECLASRGLLAALCGCPELIDSETSCNICDVTKNETLQTKNVVSEASSALFAGSIPEPSCEIVQSYLISSTIGLDTATCTTAIELSKSSPCCGTSGDESVGTLKEPPEEDAPTPTTATSCSLCKTGDPVPLPDKEILTDPLLFPTCGIAATALAALPSNDQQCYDAQALLGTYCGCPATTEKPCPICIGGEPMTKPDVFLSALSGRFGGVAPSCALYESVLFELASAGTRECTLASSVGVDCGCKPIEDHCIICPGGIDADHHADTLGEFYGYSSCQEFEYWQYYNKKRSYSCLFAQDIAWKCGCRDGLRAYGGADTKTKQALMAWAPRVTALLSLMGSFAIMWNILRTENTKTSRMYHQIMLAISASDMISSCAHMFTTLPIPVYTKVGLPELTYGAMGNDSTCKAQGFFLTLGVTSAWYNLSLSIYYKMTILNGFTERGFKKWIRALLLGLPAIFGLTFASAGIPYYQSAAVSCSIPQIPWFEFHNQIVWLALIPTTFVIISVTGITLYVFYKFRQQLQASNKWRFSSRAQHIQSQSLAMARADDDAQPPEEEDINMCLRCWHRMSSCGPILYCINFKKKMFETSLEGQVLRQSMFYLLAFYGSFPIVIVASLLVTNLIFNYPLSLFAITVAPIQGFNNALIYFRPRMLSRWNARKKRRLTSRRQRELQRRDSVPRDPNERIRRSFLRHHFFRQTLLLAEIVAVEEDAVTVGSFRLPSARGSQLWKAAQEDGYGNDDSMAAPNDGTVGGSFREPQVRGSKLSISAVQEDDYDDDSMPVPSDGAVGNSFRLPSARGSHLSRVAIQEGDDDEDEGDDDKDEGSMSVTNDGGSEDFKRLVSSQGWRPSRATVQEVAYDDGSMPVPTNDYTDDSNQVSSVQGSQPSTAAAEAQEGNSDSDTTPVPTSQRHGKADRRR